MTQKQLEEYLWGAANILRGMIDAADFKQYIFPLLFFKRISDIWDEEYQIALEESGNDLDYAEFRENHRFEIPKKCHWEDVRKKTVDVGIALQKALSGIEKANFEVLHDVFGDAQWTNKRRMSDEKMLDLIEHFSKMKLTTKEVPHDIMGDGYEYLIKKFADDSGHTAAEFYTNRTVVKLMTLITDPQPGESVYDPTCGSGGILLNSALHLKEQGKEYRTLKLYGQELNLITSAIARMNMFMHNVDEFLIVQGDTLGNPQILENDELKKFDVIMANPPYSIDKRGWNQTKWMNDPFGRNIWGTPPQGCADYAFQQHIIKSLKPDTGRCVVLFPHGVLFRDSENDLRKKMIEEDLVDAVIGLGKNLFYNSPMESILLVCRKNKHRERKGKIIFINAVNDIKIERSAAYLKDEHIKKIADSYWNYKNKEGFAKIVSNKDVLKNNNGNLSVQLYVKPNNIESDHTVNNLISSVKKKQTFINSTLEKLLEIVDGSFEKNKWNSLCIGDIAHEVSERIENPSTSGYDRFVGLEEFESGELFIKKWISTKDLISAMKLFKKGDVLFARRNAYLRRASLADFDGICSGDAIVIRTDKNKIYPIFLTLILNTNIFWEFAISNAAGAFSKRVKWRDLARFPISLPSLKEQEKIIQIIVGLQIFSDELISQQQGSKNLKLKLLNEILV